MSGREVDVLTKFETHLAAVVERPGLYVGKPLLRLVSYHLDGYCTALNDLGHEYFLGGFGYYLSLKFLISHPAWHWSRILVHVYGNDRQAMLALPGLFRDFRNELKAKTTDAIYEQVRAALLAKYGRDWHEPETTHTTIDF